MIITRNDPNEAISVINPLPVGTCNEVTIGESIGTLSHSIHVPGAAVAIIEYWDNGVGAMSNNPTLF